MVSLSHLQRPESRWYPVPTEQDTRLLEQHLLAATTRAPSYHRLDNVAFRRDTSCMPAPADWLSGAHDQNVPCCSLWPQLNQRLYLHTPPTMYATKNEFAQSTALLPAVRLYTCAQALARKLHIQFRSRSNRACTARTHNRTAVRKVFQCKILPIPSTSIELKRT